MSASALKKKPSWQCVCTVQLPQINESVRYSFIGRPRRSARRHSVALGISDSRVRRILHKDLNFCPYKMAVVQELSDCDMANRGTVAGCLIGILSDNVITLMTDEAHFHLSAWVNKQNFHYWAEENPQQLYQRPLHSACVTVWCGVANFGAISLYFFEDKNGQAVTVISVCYSERLRTSSHQNWLIVELSSRPYGSSKTVQMPIQQEHPWRSFDDCFLSMLFHCAGSFHGPHICLISLCL
jgi:hypothetical protein